MSGVAFPDVCRDCKPPKRHINCHADCKDYLDARAKHAAEVDVVWKAKKAESEAVSAVYILKRN